jgi:transposase, IS5 family
MKNSTQTNLFNSDEITKRIREKTTFLQEMKRLISWENFRPELERLWRKENSIVLGRPPKDEVLMFKVLVLQKFMGNLSDEQMELQILDRESIKDFLEIVNVSQIPDAKTIWHYREKLSGDKANGKDGVKILFEKLLQEIEKKGYTVREGEIKIVDAQIVERPIRRDAKGEKELIEKGEVPEGWNKHKISQKDFNARWKKKGNKSFFGYENHASLDSKSKFMDDYDTTDAAVHDSQEMFVLITSEDEGKEVYGDSAYRSEETEKKLRELGIKSQIHERAYREKPLTEKQKESNRIKSKTRARIEHAFATIEQRAGSFIRTIGALRASVQIGLNNLIYNIERFVHLQKVGFFEKLLIV